MDDQNATPGTLTRITTWAAHPFSSGMSALGWILFLGLVICASLMWSRLITYFEGE